MVRRVLLVQLRAGYDTDTHCGLATTVIDEDLREAYEALLNSAPCGGHKNLGDRWYDQQSTACELDPRPLETSRLACRVQIARDMSKLSDDL